VSLQVRVHEGAGPVLIYLPGIHGDWGLIGAFRRALGPRVRFVEFSYTTEPMTVEELAERVHAELSARGVESGWLLGQSFGSQIAWALLARGFRADGVVLAGGFVKHPWPLGALFFREVLTRLPTGLISPGYRVYAALAKTLARRGPEDAEEILAFARSRDGVKWKATADRLTLIARADPRPIARATRVPVLYLGGLLDALVPWPLVTRWLKRECPGYRGEVILRHADHNVLGSSPRESAEHVASWIGA
jgi:pimeloyl-ACP methyl ester carboxylesterase